MWSFKSNIKILFSFLIVAGFSFLSACGFRPLYSTVENSGQVKSSLASVSVEEPKDRLHQLVRNHLIYLLSSDGNASTSRYQLKYTVAELKTNALVKSTNQVNRIIYQITVAFKLFDLNDPKIKAPVYQGTDLVKISYTRTSSEFNNIRANKSASERAGKKAAENLHLRLAAWFARK